MSWQRQRGQLHISSERRQPANRDDNQYTIYHHLLSPVVVVLLLWLLLLLPLLWVVLAECALAQWKSQPCLRASLACEPAASISGQYQQRAG